MPLLEFFADAEKNVVDPFTVAEMGVVQVVLDAAGVTVQPSVTVPVKPLMGVRVSV